LLAGLIVIAMAARPELRRVLAQASTPQAASPQGSASQVQDAGAQARPQATPVQPEPSASPDTEPTRHQIADDSANLLKLANRLKDEVDNTTADTLSITAIRDARQIEKLAHEMRTK
jgi:hypothetical protein